MTERHYQILLGMVLNHLEKAETNLEEIKAEFAQLKKDVQERMAKEATAVTAKSV